jgi:hypothetical protein
MMTRFHLRAALLLAVCPGCDELKDDTGGTVNPCTADSTNGGWPTSVEPACVGQDILVDLSSGSAIDLDWADESDVACFPGTENLNFDGNHVFFWFAQPENSIVTVTATPESGVDSSVYVIQSANRYEVPPNVVSAVACESGYDAQTDDNPGQADSAAVTATTNPYDILIGVAGAGGTTSGRVTLSVRLEQ